MKRGDRIDLFPVPPATDRGPNRGVFTGTRRALW